MCDSAGALILFVFIGILFGAALSSLFIFYRVIDWLTKDPDGPGGWKNRFEQLNATHKEKTK